MPESERERERERERKRERERERERERKREREYELEMVFHVKASRASPGDRLGKHMPQKATWQTSHRHATESHDHL
jgi:hypothetical protein